jgi:hypothetical protein
MRIGDGDSFVRTVVTQPDIMLSFVIEGKVVGAPLKFTSAELEQRMVVDFRCDGNRVKAIFKRVEEFGSCRLLGKDASEVYLIERILAS